MESGEGKSNQLTGEFSTRKEIFIICVSVLTMLPDSAGILKLIIKPKGELSCETLSSGFQSSAWVMSCFSECLWRGELSRNAPVPCREPTAGVSTEAGGLQPVLWRRHCLFSGCFPSVAHKPVDHIKTKRVKAGSWMERWRGWGSSCFSVLKKKKKSK